MALSVQPSVFRSDILRGLQTMAKRGRSLNEMVGYIQKELDFSEDFIVPVLGYFCQAFSLPLKEVLPLREWVGTHDDQSVAPLLAHLREWQDEKGTSGN
jgi:hypothetical protein